MWSASAGASADRAVAPYAGEPGDMSPYSKFAAPYDLNYVHPNIYAGAGRDIPDPKNLTEVRIGFFGPIEHTPDEKFGQRMLHGAQLALEEANARGGYGGKPFKLMMHNDYDNWQAKAVYGEDRPTDPTIWGSASNEVVKMVYDDKDWAIFGSISSESTHIMLRVALKAEIPVVNSASTDPTIPETYIPWYFTDLQDDRVQGLTLARHIYTELGLKRVALLRVNSRYGRFGVIKFRDASRRLGHPVVIEQKFLRGDTDFRRQLQVIEDSRVDAIVLWTDMLPAAQILQQMHDLGMKQRVFGSHRTIGDELVKLAGPAAEGFEAVFPYDPNRTDPRWQEFNTRFEARFHEKPDHFAALAYDAMQILLNAICRAGLNRGRIRDALAGTENYNGVTANMVFDPNSKNIAPLFLARVHNGAIDYRRITLEKPYARVGENGVQYAGPTLPNESANNLKIGVFGSHADELVRFPETVRTLSAFNSTGRHLSLVAISSGSSWGKASTDLVKAVYQEHVLALIALDRPSSHLAEQIAVKSFVPVVAISSDRTLTSTNIPWIFRLPEGTSLDEALRTLSSAIEQAGPNRASLREALASGRSFGGVGFGSTGELRH